MGIVKAELFEQFARCFILGIMAGEDRICIEIVKGEFDHTTCCFRSKAKAPLLFTNVKADLVNALR